VTGFGLSLGKGSRWGCFCEPSLPLDSYTAEGFVGESVISPVSLLGRLAEAGDRYSGIPAFPGRMGGRDPV